MKNTIPNKDGVSIPSGMAVTSSRPLIRAKRNAIAKNSRSPTITPIAVPGTMDVMMNCVGNPKADDSNRTNSSKLATLSNIRPKKALMSPLRAQRYVKVGDKSVGSYRKSVVARKLKPPE